MISIHEETVVSISGFTVRYGSVTSKELRMIPFHSKAIGLTESGIEAVGAEFGGGIYNQGTLTLRDSIVTENYAGGGAGLFNGAKVTIENSTISGNRANYSAGIESRGVLTMTNSTVSDNTAREGGWVGSEIVGPKQWRFDIQYYLGWQRRC